MHLQIFRYSDTDTYEDKDAYINGNAEKDTNKHTS